MRYGFAWTSSLFLTALLGFVDRAVAAGEPAVDGRQVATKALKFLVSQQQENGSWQRTGREPPAVTALVIRALARDPAYGPGAEPVKKGVAYLLTIQKEDGGIYNEGLANYNTAISISGLAAVGDPALKPKIDKAVKYLKANQWTDAIAGPKGEKVDPNHPFYGGWGYGGTRGRPDVSNAAIVVEALHDAGIPPTDPSYAAAMSFISKLQNNSETNRGAAWASDDGGFIYSPGKDGKGESSAGEFTTPDGKRALRSYGSMTYAGLKSMVYAALSKDDARVKAAWSWIGKNWTVEENPGMALLGADSAKAGIFYYYSTLARALVAYGEPVVTDAKGVKHDWRAEVIAKLAAVQQADGSFIGDKKWMEQDPVIATSLAAQALEDALTDLHDHPPAADAGK